MTAPTNDRWLAVCCKPRLELVAEENLSRQDYKVYLPRCMTKQRRNGRWVDKVEVLFPRYIFIQVDPQRRSTSPVRSTRGVVGLVRFGGRPAVVPDEVIHALIRREDSNLGARVDHRPLFATGDPIKLVDGPLSGMEGVFAEQDGEKRAIVLLDLLGKANQISVSQDWVVRAA